MALKRIKLRAAIHDYMENDATFAAYAPTTQRARRRSLDILNKVVPSQAMAYELCPQWIDMAIKDLREGASREENEARARLGYSPRLGRGPAALANDAKAFKAFVKFLWRYEYLSYAKNPTAHLRSNPANRGAQAPIEKMVIQPDETVWEKILEAAAARHPRDRMTAALGAYAGLRESELKALKVSGLDFDKTVMEDGVEVPAPEVRVWRTKQQAWHRVPMSHQMEAEARRYLAWYEGIHGALDPDWFVLATRRSGLEKLTRDGRFLPDTGRMHRDTPLDPTRSPDSLTGDIRAALKNAGYGDLYRAGAHTLRRMAAIYIDKVTGNKDAAQFLLGHEVRRTTEDYLQWSDRQTSLRQMMQKMAPPGKAEPTHPNVGHSNVLPFRARESAA